MAEDRPAAVVLLSGGMDSLTALAIAVDQGYDPHVLHLNYGQKTEEAELRAFNRICGFYSIPEDRKLVCHTNFFSVMGGSSLIDAGMKVPKADPGKLGIPSTYVPFRNGVLLSMAVSYAEKTGARAVFFGAVSADSSGYPDCRRSFIDAFAEAARSGTSRLFDLKVHAPLVDMKKSKILETATKLGAPLHYTWSCYQSNDLACGECDSCALRLRAYSEIGATDPAKYALFSKSAEASNVEKLVRLKRLLSALTAK